MFFGMAGTTPWNLCDSGKKLFCAITKSISDWPAYAYPAFIFYRKYIKAGMHGQLPSFFIIKFYRRIIRQLCKLTARYIDKHAIVM